MDTHTTTVLFRATREKNPEITAMFPEEPWNEAGTTCACYVHVGQHGECSPCYVYRTRPATPEQYASLKAELEAEPYGYRLVVKKKITPRMHKARRIAARKAWGRE